jgi:MFS family permease
VFAGPLLIAAVLEGAIAAYSDLWERRRLVALGQGVLAAALVFVAWTKNAWGLTIGIAVAGAASGVACGAAQALLVVGDWRGADRAMVTWSVFASVGDVVAPLLTAAAIALGFGYRGAMLAVALCVALQCAGTARAGAPPRLAAGADAAAADPDSTHPPDPVRVALARAFRRPRLWAWLFAAATCTLLDELVVAFSTLRLQRDQGVGEAFATATAVTFSAGSLVGAVLTDRAVLRLGRRRVLVISSVLCALAVGAVLEPCGVLLSCAALFAVGVTCAPHHALAQAQAYDEMPANPGTVQACAQLFVVVDVLAPLALGFAADRFGLRAAIACLALQPAVIVACAAFLPGGRDAERR